MAIGTRKLHSVALNVEASGYLAGWRPDAGALFLPALSDGRVGDEVAVRIGIFGQSIRATVFGTISAVRRVGRPSLLPGVELTLDRMSLPAGRFLALAALGEKVSFRERAPRWVVARRLLALRDRAQLETTTLNVSEGGCALSWAGPLPMVGEVVSLKLGDGLFAASARAVVCWNALGGSSQRCVGVRLIAEGRAARAWKALVGDAARSGGRAA